MVANLHFGFDFVVCEVLLGFPTHSVPEAELLNFLILMGKWYLNHSKTREKQIYFFEFLSLIQEKLELILNGAVIVGRNAEPWQSAFIITSLISKMQ